LWEVEREREVDLFSWQAVEQDGQSAEVLEVMTAPERLEADYQAVALTVGMHPMRLMRASLPGVRRAVELPHGRHGEWVTIAGMVICRQRPGTAKGHVFISLEDETGIANAFVPSALFEAQRLVINQEGFLKIHGQLQIVDDVTSVYTRKVEALLFESSVNAKSHDFK
jgi:error-prone DNA polymerase